MGDQTEEQNNQEGQEEGLSDKELNFRRLEQQKEKAEQEATKWRQKALKGFAAQAGLDPDKKLTDLIVKEFDQAVEDLDDVSVNAFTEFAAEYDIPGFEPQTNEEDGAEQMEQFQQRGDKAANSAATPKSSEKQTEAEIAEAQQQGDWDTVFEKTLLEL